MTEPILVVETGFPPWELAEMSEELIEKMMIYKGVKDVHQFGGNWQP
jgi:hypothetical protein